MLTFGLRERGECEELGVPTEDEGLNYQSRAIGYSMLASSK